MEKSEAYVMGCPNEFEIAKGMYLTKAPWLFMNPENWLLPLMPFVFYHVLLIVKICICESSHLITRKEQTSIEKGQS